MVRIAKKPQKRSQTAVLPLFDYGKRTQSPADDWQRVAERPDVLSSGLPSIDTALSGGLQMGTSNLVAARPYVGATSFCIGAALAALHAGYQVAFLTTRLREEQLKGRFVVLESRVNGHRFAAGFVTAEDRLALAAGRERIPWQQLSIVAQRKIDLDAVDAHLFSYRPHLLIADFIPAIDQQTHLTQAANHVLAAQTLANHARRYRAVVLMHWVLPKAKHPPNRLELPGVGTFAEAFNSAVLLDRIVSEENLDATPTPLGEVHAQILRCQGHDVSERTVALRFDQRFAGLLDMTR